MANKRSRDIADEASHISQTIGNLAENTVNESELEAETVDPSDHGPPAGYEQLREQRIKENLLRMQKLGIVDLSLKLKSTISASSLKRAPRNLCSHRKTPLRSPLLVTEPPRRSSRLQNATPINYEKEVKLPKKERKPRRERFLIEVGARPEIYTEEHEKRLGNTESTWKLFVDGYGADGRRIYDSMRGKSCHQCRQKTLGHRTSCSNCQMIRGQFCGDCLYMRYGEHVLEANKNPDWICPVCRGICNCSLCRQAKGWPPTGIMYRMISSMGYKSVAHYLIQTKRAPREKESEDKDPKTPHSAKRSLAFNDKEAPADAKETQKKASSGQKLDYGDKEIGTSKDEKDGQGAVSSSEHKAGFIAGRTRSSCKNANSDASGILNTDKAGENKVVSSNKGCRKAKLNSTSPHPVQEDSIARRLRPRVK